MRFYLLLAVISVAILSSSCEKKSKGRPFNTHFWTSTKWEEELFVMVDDTVKGKLPYLAEAPLCATENLASKTLSLSLSSGDHEIVVQNKDGKVFFEEMLRLKNSADEIDISSSTDFHESASKVVRTGDCLIEEVFRK